MSTEMETRARAIYDECVRLLSDRKPTDPQLLDTATGGKVKGDATEGNGLEHCKVIVSVLDHVLHAPGAPKRRGRPKGSRNKEAKEAKTTRSGRDVTSDPKARKRPGRPKGSKNKQKGTAEKAE